MKIIFFIKYNLELWFFLEFEKVLFFFSQTGYIDFWAINNNVNERKILLNGEKDEIFASVGYREKNHFKKKRVLFDSTRTNMSVNERRQL